MLMLGVQYVNPLYILRSFLRTYSWCLARASKAMVLPTVVNVSWLQVAAKPMACGKTVATPWRATPCRHSFHQLYAGTPNRSTAGVSCNIWAAFSSRVRRETRSRTRVEMESSGFWNGSMLAMPS